MIGSLYLHFQFVLWGVCVCVCVCVFVFVFFGALICAFYERKSTNRSTNYFRISSLRSGLCWVIGLLYSDVCFQCCAQVLAGVVFFGARCSLVCVLFLLQDLCF